MLMLIIGDNIISELGAINLDTSSNLFEIYVFPKKLLGHHPQSI